MKELIKALHVIQEECRRYNQDCEGCPLHGDTECRVTDLHPCNWKINDEVQKALL